MSIQFEVVGDLTTMVINAHNFFVSNFKSFSREDVHHLRNQTEDFLNTINRYMETSGEIN